MARQLITYAYFNSGRWVADCGKCNGAELAKGDEFVCSECGHRTSLEFPGEKEDIERVLAQRPVDRNRNWKHGETVADLRIENAVHRLPSGLDEERKR